MRRLIVIILLALTVGAAVPGASIVPHSARAANCWAFAGTPSKPDAGHINWYGSGGCVDTEMKTLSITLYRDGIRWDIVSYSSRSSSGLATGQTCPVVYQGAYRFQVQSVIKYTATGQVMAVSWSPAVYLAGSCT